MVQVYADGVLIYDPAVEEYELLGLEATVSTEAGGTATIVMPPDHPAYNAFVGFKTVVEIYRNEELIFRGRALYPTDDFYNQRTITCEGELCFLRDAVMEPYIYQTSPTVIFTDVINKYNAQVESFKQFRIGSITAKDPNDYQYIACEDASQVTDVLDKLLEYVGGHITFTTASDGVRVINWLETLENESNQIIEFGENLLDYTRSDANADLATVIYPYGAKDEETGVRVDISSVNDGRLFIQDEAAIAIRGRIAKPVFWDDVTIPANLLKKAKKYLETSRMIVSTLTLSAVDLSAIDKSIDSFRVGDNVRVLSLPHGVDDVFELKERTYNLLDPSQDTITLGKETLMLTRADTAGDADAIIRLEKATQNITTNYKVYVNNAVANLPGVSDIEELTERVAVAESSITAQNDEIATKVSRTEYEVALGTKADADDLDEIGTRVSQAESTITQHADLIESKVSQSDFDSLGTRVGNAESVISQQADEIASKVSTTTFETAMIGKADKSDLLNNFVQLEEPTAEHVGDIWTQTDPRTWEDVKASTWQQIKAGTWDYAQGLPLPKTYVWDGAKWVLEGDARYITRVQEAESSIIQQADMIASKVSQTTYEFDKETMETRVSKAESEIVQQADMISQRVTTDDFETYQLQTSEQIADKVDKTITGADGTTYDVSSTVIQTAEAITTKLSTDDYVLDKETLQRWQTDVEGDIAGKVSDTVYQSEKTETAQGIMLEFNKIGLTGLGGVQSGIVVIDHTGLQIAHSNIDGKTAINADGFKLYDGRNNVIGGLMKIDGEVLSVVQALANSVDTTFYLKISPDIYGDGENGVEFVIDGENCGAITAQYLDGDVVGMRIRSNGSIAFTDENRTISLNNVYAKGDNIHFGSTEPTDAEDGDIWLCPVED